MIFPVRDSRNLALAHLEVSHGRVELELRGAAAAAASAAAPAATGGRHPDT